MHWTEYLSIKVDPNDNSSTIDSIGLNSLHDVHGLQFTSENIVIYALGLNMKEKFNVWNEVTPLSKFPCGPFEL